jgi:hypothetical protein
MVEWEVQHHLCKTFFNYQKSDFDLDANCDDSDSESGLSSDNKMKIFWLLTKDHLFKTTVRKEIQVQS